MQILTARLGPGPVLFAIAATATPAAMLIDMEVPNAHRAVLGLQPGGFDAMTGVALATAGMVVLARYPRHSLGLLMSAFGAWWALDGTASSWLAYATMHDPALPGASAAFSVYQRFGAGLLLLLPLVLLLFPDGRLPSGWWRVVSLVSLGLTSLLPLALIAAPSGIAQATSEPGPIPAPLLALNLDPLYFPLPDVVWTGVLLVAQLCVPLSLLAPFVVVVRRYRTETGIGRMRMRWLLWAAVVDLLVMLTFRLLPGWFGSVGLTVAVALTAGSVAIGIVRPDLVDVDRLLGGTLVYGILLALTFVLDLLVLGSAGRLLGSRLNEGERLVIAVFAVAIVYAQLRHRMWRLVRRWVVGDRDDPYHVMSGLAERLERTDDSEAQLLTLARAVARAFRTPYVGVEITDVSGEPLLVEDGERPAETRALPIAYRGETIGRLLLPPQVARRSRLTSGDERLLADLIRQAAAAARAVRLAEELQRSRERIVSAVEDERRRLRRELHDGLGPTLAAVASRIDTARITARRSGEDADRILGLARQELTGMLAEVRRLVHGLRPPALDDVGLVGAIRQQAERLRAPGLTVRVEERGDLTGLPAAVEVAAYRIASEALTNVVRHAKATECVVSLTRDIEDGCLDVVVEDDGVGFAAEAVAGVGLVSLRERAAELGGSCAVTSAMPKGTRVRARLPVAPSPVLAAKREVAV
ncbi:sensor histidine kinase [Acrocarpospora pleiomorpha]|uniref:sensor histidine kinase n=1 Tax=Acrocarpospora pleiomorpha TaxID=90975 RepID=UPI0012D2B232|nr:sensor histidine kinase [Acrocarpospora pleiomorpha]